MNRYTMLGSCVVAAALMGCGDGAIAPPVGIAGDHAPPVLISNDQPPAILANDDQSGIKVPRLEVARDRSSLEALWNRHYSWRSPVPPLPSVNFATDMVVGIFTGTITDGCPTLGLLPEARDHDRLTVNYVITQSKVCTAALHAPGLLAVVERTDGIVDFANHSAGQLGYSTVAQGDLWNSSGGSPELRDQVIKSSSEWAALFSSRREAPPAIDFSMKMVAAAFVGYRPSGCFRVSVTGVEERGTDLLVHVTETTPGPDAVCTQAITSPYHLVVLDRSDKNPVFVHVQEPRT